MKLGLIDGQEEKWFSDEDFPLAVGISESGSFEIGPSAERAALIWILFHDGGFSVQPEKEDPQVQFNGASLEAPVRLKDGDELKLLHLTADVFIEERGLILSLRNPATEQASGVPETVEEGEQSQQFGKKFTQDRGGGTAKRSFSAAAKLAVIVFLFLALGTVYVLLASPVHIKVTPQPRAISLTGFPPPVPVFDRYLAWPGDYVVEADAKGYRPLKRAVSVPFGSQIVFEFSLQKLPGLVSISTPPVGGADILVDGQKKGTSPLKDMEIEAGTRDIRIVSERYLPEARKIEVKGKGERQSVEITLSPAWARFSLDSVPSDALVSLNGKPVGRTPLKFEPLQGRYELRVSKKGWKPVTRKVDVRAGTTIEMPTVRLEKIDGTLRLKTEPAGATIMVDGRFRGQTPMSFALVSDRNYRLKLSKQGYRDVSRPVRVEGGKTTPLSIRLEPTFGTVFLITSPPGATLTVNGRPRGSASQRLRLQTVPQMLEVSKAGYIPFKTTITPRRGTAKKLNIVLKTVGESLKEKARKGITTPGGQRLRLIYIQTPMNFTVGAARREAGRRSNEVQYPVQLTRSFYISEKEITNREFKKFRPNHGSGNYRGISLDDPDQPVVNVSWDDAARYANWLSKKQGLVPAYKEIGEKIVPVEPLTNGYRLPTEAEWEFVSRYDGGQQPLNRPLKFPWGAAMPPPPKSGNFADDGPQRLPFAIPRYVDGYPVSAPVGKFSPNRSLIYDLGGNVAEWCHDFYDVPYADPKRPLKDPSGPSKGRFHVIKGASWRSGSVTELRLSYRDYALKARNDVGFRVVRYVDSVKK